MKCIEDEIPFELPKGWEWDRLGNISTIARGGSPRPIKAYITNDANGVNWIKIGDTEKDGKYIFSTKEKIKPEGVSKSRFVKSGDFLLTNSMSFGRPYILKTEGCIHDGWLVIGDIELVFDQDYLYYALSANYMYQTMAIMAGGSTVDNLNSDLVKSLLFPIPPINEQKLIAHKVSDLLDLVELIKNNEEIIVREINLLKSKILDLAIRGKLISQNPEDEPASVLLERIRAEKEELIKAGKIKRDKKESVIFKGEDNSYYRLTADKKRFDAEIPFEIPKNWCWTTLPSVASVELGKTLDKAKNTGSYHPYLRSVNVQWGYIDLSDLNEMKFEEHEIDKYSIKRNDLLICEGGDVGRCCIWEINDTFLYQNALHRVRFYADLEPRFYLYVMMLYESLGILKNISTGVTIKHLTGNVLSAMPVPLPPLSEQKRIVEASEVVFAQLDEITSSIS